MKIRQIGPFRIERNAANSIRFGFVRRGRFIKGLYFVKFQKLYWHRRNSARIVKADQ